VSTTYEKTDHDQRVLIHRTTEMPAELFFEQKFNHLAQVVNALAYELKLYPKTEHGKEIAKRLRAAVTWMPEENGGS
jgi:hypothetical protein